MSGLCRNCDGEEWVCESHLDRPWGGVSAAPEACHCGGAGAPCPVCRPEMANAALIQERDIYLSALQVFAAYAPVEKPDGPYDPMGGYSSDNHGDVIADAQAESDWHVANAARAAIAKATGA